MPWLRTWYVADNAHCPYGPRPAEEVRRLVGAVADRFLAEGCAAIVLACNTATAAAVEELRACHPEVPVVGMEPAVKPAAARSRTGVIGVLATGGTLHGRLFRGTSARYAAGVRVVASAAGELVGFVERGELDTPALREALRRHVGPMVEAGADQIVLGCTHFPFLAPAIRAVAGEGVSLVDPAPAVARQLARRLGAAASPMGGAGAAHRFESTGGPVDFARYVRWLDEAPGRR